jgi:transcriptional pleiotropic repressor
MSSVQLLDKTRKIGKLLHNNDTSKVVFNDICKVMRDIVDSNVLVISKKGKVLGVGTCEKVEELQELVEDTVGGFIDPMLKTSRCPFYERERESGYIRI